MQQQIQEETKEIEIVKVWTYCLVCERQLPHVFDRDQGNYEVYKCPKCGTEHAFAVR